MTYWRLLPLSAILVSAFACGGGDDFEIVRQPLELAAERGDLAEVERLIAAGTDIEGAEGTFNPLTQAASYAAKIEIVRALLDAGANPDGRGKGSGWCWAMPLSNAIQAGNIETSRLLLDSGASFDTQCSDYALAFLSPPAIDLLVEYGLDLEATDGQGRNVLHHLLGPEFPPSIVLPTEGIEYLIQTGAPLNAPDAEGKTPFARWREPRSYETFELRRWLWSAVFGEPDYIQKARKQRTEITGFLTSAGATL